MSRRSTDQSVNSTQNWAGQVDVRFMPAGVALSQDNPRDPVTWILSLEPAVQ